MADFRHGSDLSRIVQESLSSLWDLSKEAGESMAWCGWNYDRNSATKKNDWVVNDCRFLSEYDFDILSTSIYHILYTTGGDVLFLFFWYIILTG
jgi:hypothetical protein